jgi:hypothetical protein
LERGRFSTNISKSDNLALTESYLRRVGGCALRYFWRGNEFRPSIIAARVDHLDGGCLGVQFIF